MTDPSLGKVDRTAFSVVSRDDPDDTVAYWLTRPLQERIRAAEQLRRIIHGYGPDARLQRVLTITEREPR